MVATTIHHPSASTLLNDGVRVLTRLIGQAKEVVGDAVGGSQPHLADLATAANAGMKQIMPVARQQGELAADARTTASRDLVDLTQTVVDHAQQTVNCMATATPQPGQRMRDQVT